MARVLQAKAGSIMRRFVRCVWVVRHDSRADGERGESRSITHQRVGVRFLSGGRLARCGAIASRRVKSIRYRAEGEAMGHVEGWQKCGFDVCWFATKRLKFSDSGRSAEVKRARARATIVRGRNKSARAGSNIMNRARARAISDLSVHIRHPQLREVSY